MRRASLLSNTCWMIKSLSRPQNYVQSASYMKIKTLPNYDDIEFPEKKKLRLVDKTPQPVKNTNSHVAVQQRSEAKYCRGPDVINNRLIYGQYGVQALDGGLLTAKHFDAWRLYINAKLTNDMFAEWRVEPPWKPVSKKGQGKRMGKGKSPISHYVTPVKADRIIMEIGGKIELRQVYRMLRHVANQCPFHARIVSEEILKKEEEQENWIRDNNLNPFSYKYCAKNNFLGIRKDLSPYDLIFFGKYR
ncbi:large ribosomal subunit protein uL16m-like [Saccostrea echinata]|uniref:large ribosomal subunit protein uL16m-like n=1 Tax=Saccostrea echinata TaxID=191078 RepID=UPI002A819E8A|nr:large ribosomal subunit protein uL16m-like [Saccostrea echinata]